MAGQGRVVRHDDMVADLAVMRDVSAHHEQAAVANAGHHAAAFGAGIHRHVFADRVMAADHETRFLAAVFQILGLEADRGEGEDARLFADRCAPVDDDMGDEGDTRPEHDLPTDDAVRTDRDILGQCRPRRDDRGGVDLRHRLPNRRGSWRRRSPRPSIGRPLRRGPRTSRHCRGCAAW